MPMWFCYRAWPQGRAEVDDDPDGLAARREACLQPRVVRAFLQKYDGAKTPREDVALKVLKGLQVPSEAMTRAWVLICEAPKYGRFLKEFNGVYYVDLKNSSIITSP